MAHTIANKDKLVARVRRIRGQVEAIERALEAEAECGKVMHLLASARAAMTGLTMEVLEDHVRTHLVDPDDPEALAAADDLVGVLRSYMK